jgi:hypothetical protein
VHNLYSIKEHSLRLSSHWPETNVKISVSCWFIAWVIGYALCKCNSSQSLQTGKSGSEESPRRAGDDEERGADIGPEMRGVGRRSRLNDKHVCFQFRILDSFIHYTRTRTLDFAVRSTGNL